MRTYSGEITKLQPGQVAVVGTNYDARHGKGAANWASINAGLKYGISKGRCGNTFAIITKDLRKKTHPSVDQEFIIEQIIDLYCDAERDPKTDFIVFYSGTGENLNGYTPKEMAFMFSSCGSIPDNIIFEETFSKLVNYTGYGSRTCDSCNEFID